MSQQIKTDTAQNPNRAEIKELIKSGKAFSFIGETISKAYKSDDDDNYYIECIGSSDQEDLVGDVMTAKALQTMERDFVGKTVFMNHRTMVPDDVFGAIVEAKIIKENGVQLLWFKIVVESENEPALKTWRMINGGRVQLGTSVTVLVRSAKPNPARKGGIMIDDVEPIEHSIVGVPCNRESKAMAASASKALDLARLSGDPETPVSKSAGIHEAGTEDESAVPSPEPSSTPENLIEEGETEMITENTDTPAAVDTAENPETVLVADDTPAESNKFFARTVAAIAAFKSLSASIAAKAENIEVPQVAVKGMFNEILEQEPRLWELFDILNEVRWGLMSQKYNLEYLGQTDFTEILAAWDGALDEFKAAAVVSFKYWGDFSTGEVISNSLAVEQTFLTLAEAYESASGETARGSLRETGKQLLEIAKSIGIEFESAAFPADVLVPEPTIEQIEKSASFLDLQTKFEKVEKDFEQLTEEHEIAKAALEAATEAIRADLREPLGTASQTATS